MYAGSQSQKCHQTRDHCESRASRALFTEVTEKTRIPPACLPTLDSLGQLGPTKVRQERRRQEAQHSQYMAALLNHVWIVFFSLSDEICYIILSIMICRRPWDGLRLLCKFPVVQGKVRFSLKLIPRLDRGQEARAVTSGRFKFPYDVHTVLGGLNIAVKRTSCMKTCLYLHTSRHLDLPQPTTSLPFNDGLHVFDTPKTFGQVESAVQPCSKR